MKKKTTPTFLMIKILFFIFLLSSCQSTDIYFDIKNQSIVSCNGRPLKRILIECDSLNLKDKDCYYDLFVKNKNIKIPSALNINEIINLYDLKNVTQIFYSNSCYKITFVGGGDDGYTDLKIWTNNKGQVYKTNKSTCK
ncbi:hypothetical protein [Flavobacterium defluvii]|uniref:Lipoprotein n=1 Tax=Flavobacterium defluvii TaxID=370979 RepID=A0A1M5E7C7_9FLAO|nr:hypothetical protein [Flavobacterium defluvii]SHF75065.1 hypothetical protein SAMN05443663_10150 [Flavobacterium defluvii]